ncbi:type IV pilin-like G/H family protein [Lyngbya sp. PCC 8106]|uniref:type IV pilin-like G/H family protein n=1 Tax=Lyngbya sp. (strain PCC 8106) TaxID=313612 RepID=UPI0000EA8CA5|nr:type IV pilin-like G/H family protein [Lyngbya sp. PCC 8106]EAW36253.1 serine/threonine kinase [Lyngbya sp. PCC 8106]
MPSYLAPLIATLMLTSVGCSLRTQSSSPTSTPSSEIAPISSPDPRPRITESDYPMVLPSGQVDYSRLKTLLSQEKWREADEETWQVMLIAAGQANLAIDENFIVRFPCKDLKTIDKLWIKHSNGHFGFSVQKRIWESLGGPANSEKITYETSIDLLERFLERVPWDYDNTEVDLSSPEGYLPFVGFRGIAFAGGDWWIFSLMQRLETCKMPSPPNDQVFTRIEPPGATNRMKESEAKQYISAINKAQEVYYSEKNRFGTSIGELGIGIKAETENYTYQIVVGADQRNAIATATSKHSDLTSFTAVIFVVNQNDSETTVTQICETEEPSKLPPPTPKRPTANDEIQCPSGSRSL